MWYNTDMNPNIVLGIFLLSLSTITIVFSFLIAAKQYIFPKAPVKNQASLPPQELIKLFLQLLDDILKAPPALAFLVVGLLIGTAGITILFLKPL